jgi:hypothetical protein
MKNKILLAILVLLSSSAFADNEMNSWYAGTTYQGQVETSGLVWNCSGGTCKLTGPYGTGLNMEICKDLSQKVGGLQYYYNDSGMVWNKTKNGDLLEQCNANY